MENNMGIAYRIRQIIEGAGATDPDVIEYRIKRTDDEVQAMGYAWDVQIWRYFDGSWRHAGYGRYCKTLEEAKMYIAERSGTA